MRSLLVISVTLAVLGITGSVCLTAIHFAEAPNGLSIDVEAQPHNVRMRANVTVGSKILPQVSASASPKPEQKTVVKKVVD